MGTVRNLSFALPLVLAGGMFAGTPVAGLNHFATASYHELAHGDADFIASPFSISTAVSMLLNGARGETAQQMATVLDQTHPEAVAALIEKLTSEGNAGGNELLIANGVWGQRGFKVLGSFEQTMQSLFHAPLTPLDFLRDPEQARAEINSWTAEHTKGKIQDLFGPGSLNPRTRLILTTAIYFHGKWQSPFPPVETRPDAFRLGTGGTVQTKFMHQTGDFGYAETPSIQVLEMKYGGTPLAFDVLLPKRDDGLAGMEKSLDRAALSEWLGAIRNREVEVALPRFRAESEFSLREALSHMGMRDAFEATADFSGIDDRRDLFLADVLHKAFVDVTEEGTEAAAATGSMVQFVAMAGGPKRPVFRADHPFAFLIRDARSGAILFEGRMMKPGA